MICPKCGAEIPRNSDCCLECGAEIDKKQAIFSPKMVRRLGHLAGIIVCVALYFIALNTPIILFNFSGRIVVFLAALIGLVADHSIETIITIYAKNHATKEECEPEVKRVQIRSIIIIIVIVVGIIFGILQILINGGV